MTRPVLHVAEPPAHFRLRQPLVVDCSLLVATVFSEPWRDQAQALMAGCELHAPSLLQYELANVAVKRSRQGMADLVADALRLAGEMAIELHRIQEDAVVVLARSYELSAYDASYLWLAAELKCALATFDAKLAAAAKAHLGAL